jgi:alkylation response protein AidB-like acyl-CoA dehydrogenase
VVALGEPLVQPDVTDAPGLLLEPPLREQIEAYVEPRAGAIDAAEQDLGEVVGFLDREIIGGAGLPRIAQTIATTAGHSMSAAFSLWCHRMVQEYLACAPVDSPLRSNVLPRLQRTAVVGSTALAAAMAHYVGGAPLTVNWRQQNGQVVLNGRVNWASNLLPGRFVMVTAAAHEDDGREIVVALPSNLPGLHVDPYPTLLALQATASSSLRLDGVRQTPEWVITEAFSPFIGRVRPTFLLLQSSFCWGLAARALVEARRSLRGVNDVFTPDLLALEGQLHRLERALQREIKSVQQGPPGIVSSSAGTAVDATSIPGARPSLRQLVQLRLDSAQLATAAVALEAKAVGGRGYVTNSPTARRFREAAFLPIQAPTEGQLRWELSHCA